MAFDPARVSPGVPTGGQFATSARTPADLDGMDLTPPEVSPHIAPTAQQWQNRIARLQAHGYLPPAALEADARDTASAKGAIREDVREDWWDRQHAVVERNSAEGSYAQMPDDNTPNMTPGRASSEKRRTHRMNYRGDDVSLRMPSATAIKRFANESNRKTFDVPVTAEYPGGSVQGWVRVTQGADGEWETKGLNFTDADEAYVGEAVRAVLEAKRPRHALTSAGDLIARRRLREGTHGAELRPVDSSWVKEVGYDANTGTTFITTQTSEKAYGWQTSPQQFAALMNAEKPGVVVNSIKKGSMGVATHMCPKCGRAYAEGREHRCRIVAAPRSMEPIAANERTVDRGLRGALRRSR